MQFGHVGAGLLDPAVLEGEHELPPLQFHDDAATAVQKVLDMAFLIKVHIRIANLPIRIYVDHQKSW